ncbi:MAG: lysylphosphatidylglycerol synthase transmembrane domain-containing protein [Chthoniobacter sp.]|uniref:lysylphosphatidylglycerol synthase transmembrane domain-containing protein n=1 Tax=Chthoniobacter sp. TaxID=2510640 RepID=UPI0032A41F6A
MKKVLVTTLQIAVTVAILFVLFRDPHKRAEMATTLSNANPWWLFLGFAMYGVVEFFAGWRWQILLRVQGITLSWFRIFSLLLIGVFFNFFIPGGTGGDVIKIFYLLKETPGKRTVALLSVLVDRLVGLIALAVFAAVLIAADWQWLMSSTEVSRYVWPALFILGSSFAGLHGAYLVTSRGWIHRLPARMPGRDKIAELALAYNLYGRAWRPTLAAFGLSFIAHLAYFAVFYCTGQALRHSGLRMPTFGEMCAIMPVVNTLSAMPISLGGLGVREGLFQIFLNRLCGVRETDAVLISSTGYLLTFCWGLIGGAIYLFYRPTDHARLRDIKSEIAALEHTVAEEEVALETAEKEKR